MMQVKLIKQQYVITLPRETVNSPPLEVLKAGLDGDLGNLISWLEALPMARDGN